MTTSSFYLFILDVGHGNCTILTDGEEAFIIDCGAANVPLETLKMFGISKIKSILISHADEDHIKVFLRY